jgi:hypothetical protein
MRESQHRTRFFLTSDLAIEFTVFDHHASQVPDTAWIAFTEALRHARGHAPANGLTVYVTRAAAWSWDRVYGDGSVVIGDPDGPFTLESDPDGPAGCRIVFWHEGTPYDTGLRVWEQEASIISRLLLGKAEAERTGDGSPYDTLAEQRDDDR